MEELIYSDYMISRALRGHVVIRTINLLLGFAFQILVVKILAPADYAAYAVLLAFLMTTQVFGLFGIDRTILRFVPHLTKRREFNVLWTLIGKLAAVRFTAVAIFILILMIVHNYVFQLLRVEPSKVILMAIAVWFLAITILADTDALAQSWMMHFQAALIATFEILARISTIIFFYHWHKAIDLDTIVILSATTIATASILIVLRLLLFTRYLRNSTPGATSNQNRVDLDVREAPSYAAASYVSTLGWVITNPLMFRLVASTGLGFVALGAFSFAQGLMFSITRALPGMLILPAIEPVLMADVAGGAAPNPRLFRALSLAVKLEFLAIFALLIPATIAGPDILRLLAKPEFAPYYFIIPFLLIYFMFAIVYRVLEIVVRMALRHRLFVILWPLGLLSLVLTYMTVSQWGVWSVLIWPIVEIAARIGALLIFFRIDGATSALDPVRTLMLAACTACIILMLLLIQYWFGAGNLTASTDYVLGFIGLLTLGGTLFVIKPFRTIEYEHLLRMIPKSLPLAQNFLYYLTRP